MLSEIVCYARSSRIPWRAFVGGGKLIFRIEL